jgi:cytochrome c biogenesis protein
MSAQYEASPSSSLPTAGVELQRGSRAWRETLELVSSMRFAISLLVVICIASMIGTVVRQHEPLNNYINQFGPFWADVFGTAGMYTVYSTAWFLIILGFLVISTSLCIARNVPKIATDLRTYKEYVREQALQAFHHKARGEVAETGDAALQRVSVLLATDGWKAKAEVRPNGTMVAARKGGANKLGYLAAHSAIVLICLGGLADGDLIVRLQMAIQGKRLYTGGTLTTENRLGPSTPTFRASIPVPEGGRSSLARIDLPDGLVVVELPFDIELKKFIVDYYPTGMPKLFASDIVIHDRDTGQATPATVKVNEPATHRGVTIYQSSFDDGGSTVTLRAFPFTPGGKPFDVHGVIGDTARLTSTAEQQLTLEFTGLRVINVENLAGSSGSATDVRKVDLVGSLKEHLGSGAKSTTAKTLRNVGPSVSYKLRDAAGQAREFNNYMLPIELDGQRVFLAGTRDTPDESYRYLRIPADENDRIDGWVRLRDALLDPALREQAVQRYVTLATPADRPEMAPQLRATASRVLALFAGAEPAKKGEAPVGGLKAVSDFLEGSVPEAERARISEVLLRILNGTLFELANLSRERAGEKPLQPDEKAQGFMTQAVLALSDSFFYPAPLLLELTDFKQVQASVFQVARTPGKTFVYLGAVLLIVGVFSMLYIRERRLWIWLEPGEAAGRTRITAALSVMRRTLDADTEFDTLRKAILQEGKT